MRVVIVLSLVGGAVGAMALPAAAAFAQPFDARPEAILVGVTLLLVASGLRRGVAHRHSK